MIQNILKTLMPLSIFKFESPLSLTSNSFCALFFSENDTNSRPSFVFLLSTLSVGSASGLSNSGTYSTTDPMTPSSTMAAVAAITTTAPALSERSVLA